MKSKAGMLRAFQNAAAPYVVLLSAGLSAGILLTGCAGKEEAHDELSQQTEQEAADHESTQINEAQPLSFEGVDIEGNRISSAVFADAEITMVNVWATYCNPCLREMPGLGELAGAYDAGEFQIIGIVSDVLENADQKAVDLVKDLIEQTNAQYPHMLLNESVYYALLTDVSVVPTTFFIDRNGVILDTVTGAMDQSAWKEKIDEFLGKE